MKSSPVAAELIKKIEGLSLIPYKCPGGVLTIGYGHTKTTKPGMKITAKEADALLADDIKECEESISKLVVVPITQNNFDALVDFVFNLGESNFKKSTLLKRINAKRFYEAADEFLKWNDINGKPSIGLTNRRAAERNLFLNL